MRLKERVLAADRATSSRDIKYKPEFYGLIALPNLVKAVDFFDELLDTFFFAGFCSS